MSDVDALHIIKQFITDHSTRQVGDIETPLYSGTLPINGREYSVIGAFFDIDPHQLTDCILAKYNSDIVLLMNISDKVVLMRRGTNCDIDLSKLAKKLSVGGGKADVAGCLLNDTIINITKLLQPC